MIRHFRLGVVLSVVLAMCVADALGFTLLNYMNIDYATKPSFHPGGNEFAYISNLTGVPQVWRIQALTGYQYQVTFDTNGVDGVWWSPFNPAIMVISAAVGGNERSQLYLINPAGGEWSRLTSDDDAIYSFGCWSPDGSRFSYATNARDKVNFECTS